MRGPIWAPTCVGDKRCDFKSCSFARAGCDREHPASGIDERDPLGFARAYWARGSTRGATPRRGSFTRSGRGCMTTPVVGRCVMGRSVFECLGGNAAVTSVVEDFVVRCAGDSRINKKFGRTEIGRASCRERV